MRNLLCFTLMTASSFAFEKPDNTTSHEPNALPEVDYSKVKPIEQSSSARSAYASETTQSQIQAPTVMPEKQSEPTAKSKTPFLGVLGDSLSAPMQAHLGIKHGLLLQLVDPGSPADKVGLQIHDVIHSVNGKTVANQAQLRKLITERTVNCVVNLDIYSKGQLKSVDVPLCDKPKAKKQVRRQPLHQNERLSEIKRFMEERANATPPTNAKENSSGIGRMFGKLLKEVAPNLDLNFESTASVIVQDESGSVEIQTINGAKNVIVKDTQNRVEFEGSWNTEEDFAKALPQIKERIDKVGSGYKQLGRGIGQPLR